MRRELDLDAVMARMNDQTGSRFEELLTLAFDIPDDVCLISKGKSRLPEADSDRLTECEIVAFVDEEEERMRPTKGTLIAFTIVQEKLDDKPKVKGSPEEETTYPCRFIT